jgi:hypothetical protein
MRVSLPIFAGLLLVACPAAFATELQPPESPGREVASDALKAEATTFQQRSSVTSVAGRIVNGRYTTGYPSVGILLAGPDLSSSIGECTGTLIDPTHFLTAAHCVHGLGAHYYVFLPHGGFYNASAPIPNPDYVYGAATADIAVVPLSTRVEGVRPSPITAGTATQIGTSGTIVGYGRAGGNSYDFGLKRIGAVLTSSCGAQPPTGPTDAASICWDFSNPLGQPGQNSNTCNGDSGGPLFITEGGTLRLAGITVNGVDPFCLPGDHSWDTRVTKYAGWIKSVDANLGVDSCGSLACTGEDANKAPSLSADGHATSANPVASFTFSLVSGVSLLRVSLNGYGDAVRSLKMEARKWGTEKPDARCRPTIAAHTFVFCAIANPDPGVWEILVTMEPASPNVSAEALYQVVASTFRP